MLCKVLKIASLLLLSFSLMGNQGCKEEPQMRELRRRVQMGSVNAPDMPLPNGQQFDFKFAANAQMYSVLKKFPSFTTATVASNDPLDPSQLSGADLEAFYTCTEQKNAFHTEKMSSIAMCMIRLPQARINADIINFQLVTSGGLTVGIPQWGNLEAGVGFKKAILTMAMRADDPYIDNHTIAATTQKSKATEVSFNGSVGFGMIGLGWQYYQTSDLAAVVEKAMGNSISELKTQWNKAEEWYGMVLRACDTTVMINAGGETDSGLKVGDLLEIYNVYYDWEGEVCDSQLLGTMMGTPKGQPIAVVRVDIVGDTMSRATVIEQTGDKIMPGARAYVRTLAGTQAVKSLR